MALGAWAGRIKFGLEIATLVTALTALASIAFTYRQMQLSIASTQLAAYQQIISNSIEFDKSLVEHPELRPYFKESKVIEKSDPAYNQAALIAELQLDVIDSIIAFPLLFTKQSEVLSWGNTFNRSFRESPLMCELLQERREQYHDQTVAIAKTVCLVSKPW